MFITGTRESKSAFWWYHLFIWPYYYWARIAGPIQTSLNIYSFCSPFVKQRPKRIHKCFFNFQSDRKRSSQSDHNTYAQNQCNKYFGRIYIFSFKKLFQSWIRKNWPVLSGYPVKMVCFHPFYRFLQPFRFLCNHGTIVRNTKGRTTNETFRPTRHHTRRSVCT